MTPKAKRNNMRVFFILIITQTISMIGSQISGLAISIWVFNETGNATPLALVAFFTILPRVVASGVAGVLADRWNRKYVMAISDAGQAVGTVLLLISFLSGEFQLWHLYVIVAIQGIFGVFQGPAFGAAITMLIPDQHRDRANAIRQLTGPVAGIIAPAVAGLVFAAVGIVGTIMIDLATFLVAVVVVLLITIPQPEKTKEGIELSGSMFKEFFAGLRFLYARKALMTLLVAFMITNFLLSGLGVLITPYLLARTGSEAILGIILSIFNVGGLVGGLIMTAWGGTRPRIHTILPGLIMLGFTFAIFGMAQTVVALGITAFFVLIPAMIINPAALSVLQAKVPPDAQGRVFATVEQISMLLMPISYLLVGPLVDQVFEPAVGQPGWSLVAPLVGDSVGSGMGLLIVIGGAMTIIVGLVTYSMPRVRHLEADLPDYEAVPAPSEEEDAANLPVDIATV